MIGRFARDRGLRTTRKSFSAWEMEFWDAARWRPRTVIQRVHEWSTATRRRRWTTWIVSMVFAIIVVPGIIGAVATAHAFSTGRGSSPNVGTSWMNVKDSYNVPVSSYMIVIDHGGLLNPGNTALSLVIGVIFAGWLVITTSGIWLIGFALDFRWLDMIGSGFNSAAKSLVHIIATPLMLATAATIGAFFVGWFIIRGYHAKAVIQVVTMFVVAVVGPIFLADPLEDVLSSDGLLAQGRNVGLSVAAGLNGNSNPNPNQLIATLQVDMADNFIRRPLQLWNYDHVVDDQPGCSSAWTSGMMSGSEDQVKKGLEGCNDDYAVWSANNPGFGKIGAGFILLLAAIIQLIFSGFFAVKVVSSGLRAIYHAIMAIFGFAAGGFVYGVTQTFLVRNLVDAIYSGICMAGYTIFLAFEMLILRAFYTQAGSQVMMVAFITALLQLAVILQFRKFGTGLQSGNQWLANRVALAVQGPGKGGGGGGGGTALGMGAVGARRTMGAGALATLGVISTVGGSPVTEWMWAKTRSPFRPYARMEKRQLSRALPYTSQQWYQDSNAQSIMKFVEFSNGAREYATRWGGINTYRGAAAAIQGMIDMGGSIDNAKGALVGAGFTDEKIMTHAIRSWKRAADDAEDETMQYKHLGHVVSAMQHAQRSSYRLERGLGSADEAAADLATLQEASFRFHRANDNNVTLDGGRPMGRERAFLNDYFERPSAAKMKSLMELAKSDKADGTGLLKGISPQDAQRMRNWMGNEHAKRVLGSVDQLLLDPADKQRFRDTRGAVGAALNTDIWVSGKDPTPWHSIAPPKSDAASVGRSPVMDQVRGMLNDHFVGAPR
ncbi:hypothetical protein [Nocardia sp. NPDC051463]|uniref:hypothetical protein n=1 Tax=Nocardia sp. NPDC051463 TaxID=3154845 RepID=UPI0034289717